jgi:outer membrane protein OmpA-like peptidoglycan-associated protein
MKFLALAAAVLLYSFSNWQVSHYREELRPKLLAKANEELGKAGYRVTVAAAGGMDVELSGAVPGLDDRIRAQAIVDGIEGLRAIDRNNALKVPARVDLRMEPGSGRLQFSGRLGSMETARKMVEQLQALESVDAVLTKDLVFDPLVVDPEYLTQAPFVQLLTDFFELPGNGILLATECGIRLQGVATVKLGESWARAEERIGRTVRPEVMQAAAQMTSQGDLPNRFRVRAEVKFYPSALHMPLYRQDAPLTAERLSALSDVLGGSEIAFPVGGAEVMPEQQGKLEQAARGMRAAGERVRFVVGGFYLAGDGGAARERLAGQRAETVADALVALGVVPGQMEVTAFALPAGSGEPEAPESHRVEIRVR